MIVTLIRVSFLLLFFFLLLLFVFFSGHPIIINLTDAVKENRAIKTLKCWRSKRIVGRTGQGEYQKDKDWFFLYLGTWSLYPSHYLPLLHFLQRANQTGGKGESGWA
jgi:hypothetical protein